MKNQNVFKRYEIKYLITKEEKEELLNLMKLYMHEDDYGKSTICNIYFDTPDSLLIRRSLEKPIYKEKFRVRSYGVANDDSKVFVEIKKKYKSVVYKRRVSLTQCEAMSYICDGVFPSKRNQITDEIDYFLSLYKDLIPKVFLSYEREALYSKTDSDFRITFDENILWRDYDLSLCKGVYGDSILQKDMVLMEIKTANAIPIWMANFLSAHKIYKTSFSKYGNAYLKLLLLKGA
ncbi:MAG: polyphosphate polymerase domain-containing protein [Oscillospiraceae bacterium]